MTQLSGSGSAAALTVPGGAIPDSVAVDGDGNIWVGETGPSMSILELNNSGTLLSGALGFQAGQTSGPESVAIDASGNVWYTSINDSTIHELVGAAAPVVVPIATGVANNTLGTLP